MKRLGKLSIRSEMIINDEGLISLKGGYGGYYHFGCVVWSCGQQVDYAEYATEEGPIPYWAEQLCETDYDQIYGPGTDCDCDFLYYG